MITTGYFADPSKPYRNFRVHAIANDLKPMCGVRIGENSQYQWCAHGILREYITCQRCLDTLDKEPRCPHCGYQYRTERSEHA